MNIVPHITNNESQGHRPTPGSEISESARSYQKEIPGDLTDGHTAAPLALNGLLG